MLENCEPVFLLRFGREQICLALPNCRLLSEQYSEATPPSVENFARKNELSLKNSLRF